MNDRLTDEPVGRDQTEGLQLNGEGGLLQQLNGRLLESTLLNGESIPGRGRVMARSAVPAGMRASVEAPHRRETPVVEVCQVKSSVVPDPRLGCRARAGEDRRDDRLGARVEADPEMLPIGSSALRPRPRSVREHRTPPVGVVRSVSPTAWPTS